MRLARPWHPWGCFRGYRVLVLTAFYTQALFTAQIPCADGGFMSEGKAQFLLGDCASLPFADKSIDLVFCSPPYEAARTYGIDFALKGQDWVDWAVPRYLECLRVCKGLVVWVVEGQTKKFRYSCTPVLLMAELHRLGVHVRKPPVYHRSGIPGSGGPDWWRNDWEWCVCATNGGRLPWSDNTACGEPCKCAPGGRLSNRHTDGTRANSHHGRSGELETTPDGVRGIRRKNGSLYVLEKANPGNVIKGSVGGGALGHKLAHDNEAPFPEWLAERFIKSFCPPGGKVLDPFSGSGTTACVAAKLGRFGVGIDIRESQKLLGERRATDCNLQIEGEVAA
jgi:hypothetical protein